MRRIPVLVLTSVLSLALAACPAPAPNSAGGSGQGSGSQVSGINPDGCGNLSTNKLGRKVFAFLVASKMLDHASIELEQSVKGACVKMASELQVSTEGDTRTVCKRAAETLDSYLEVSVKTESRLVTRHKPPVCTTDISFGASIVAECEATLAADVAVTCEGSCGGTCSGACDGTCSSGSSSECAGQCDGVCRGSCSGSCNGYASVDASAECKASAEVQASVNTTCSEPEVEVVREDVTIIDATKFDMAMAAIDAGLPTMLQVGAKAKLLARAAVLWAKTAGSLARASGDLVNEFGKRSLCVGGQLAAALAAVAQVEARFTISIEVSAEVSASAGAGS